MSLRKQQRLHFGVKSRASCVRRKRAIHDEESEIGKMSKDQGSPRNTSVPYIRSYSLDFLQFRKRAERPLLSYVFYLLCMLF